MGQIEPTVRKQMTDVILTLTEQYWKPFKCEQNSSRSFENGIDKMCLQIICYSICMYIEEMALNNNSSYAMEKKIIRIFIGILNISRFYFYFL